MVVMTTRTMGMRRKSDIEGRNKGGGGGENIIIMHEQNRARKTFRLVRGLLVEKQSGKLVSGKIKLVLVAVTV